MSAVPSLSLNEGDAPRLEHRKSTGHIQTGPRLSKEEKMKEFFKSKDAGKFIAGIVAVLLRDKPNDIMAHIVKHILSEKQVSECSEPEKYMDDEGRKYLKDRKIIVLIEEFLINLVDEAPEDVGQYAIAWLRWNKQRFNHVLGVKE
eukprot:Hpha_TRINITY_DN11083_c0_g1::TRINITY_DN11083_c0_g1_i1::g.92648::m.92648